MSDNKTGTVAIPARKNKDHNVDEPITEFTLFPKLPIELRVEDLQTCTSTKDPKERSFDPHCRTQNPLAIPSHRGEGLDGTVMGLTKVDMQQSFGSGYSEMPETFDFSSLAMSPALSHSSTSKAQFPVLASA